MFVIELQCDLFSVIDEGRFEVVIRRRYSGLPVSITKF